MKQHLFIIGTVWPEPNSSAAGSRLLQLIKCFQKQNWQISFASAAQKSEHSFDLSKLDIPTYDIKINDVAFDELIKQLNPSMVMFDRFIIEEQFGWRVKENCPTALRIIDTIDLHCLRNERHLALKQNRDFKFDDLLKNELAKREIASIYRCDLSLMVSEVEMQILQNTFKIDASLLHYTAFMFPPLEKKQIDQWPSFNERSHFLSIGNFLHEPNWDSVQFLKKDIWPKIKKQLPNAELHIYGAYTSDKVMQLNNVKEGFLIKGRAEEVDLVMKKARICLAPLRFGAGIKGKIADAMLNGTPCITTNIGAESMHGNLNWNGFICESIDEIVSKAIELYTNESIWRKSQENGIQIIKHYFNEAKAQELLIAKINYVLSHLEQHRRNNFIGNLLYHHQMASSKYMAMWIESKNKLKA